MLLLLYISLIAQWYGSSEISLSAGLVYETVSRSLLMDCST